jgi:phosphate transport system permease protein
MGDTVKTPETDLIRSYGNIRTLKNRILTIVTIGLSLVALFPLFSVLYMLLMKGGSMLSLTLFTELPPQHPSASGGIGNAVVGTLVTVGIAGAIAIPFGILAAIFLAEFGRDGRLATTVRFAAKVLTGMPSILAGVFAYATVVMLIGRYNALAGGIALAVLMLPTVLLTAEEAIKMVPTKMREAAYGMGATDTQCVTKVVVPTAMPAILTRSSTATFWPCGTASFPSRRERSRPSSARPAAASPPCCAASTA